jgi:hypothetical protein
MLDLMSADGGLGFVRGIGWNFAHSVPGEVRSRFNEAHDLIIKAWTSPRFLLAANYQYQT